MLVMDITRKSRSADRDKTGGFPDLRTTYTIGALLQRASFPLASFRPIQDIHSEHRDGNTGVTICIFLDKDYLFPLSLKPSALPSTVRKQAKGSRSNGSPRHTNTNG
jgi:hypothetical protein